MSDSAANRIVQKLWSYCHVLRDDGLSYQDYLEQLTFLLFLKMADERERLTGDPQPIPVGCRGERLAAPAMEGAELERHYRETLRVLGTRGGMLGLIFEKAQNRIQDPAKLRRLIVELIGREDWSAMAADVKGDAYEGLLEKNAQDVKGGAGQYFTPRAVIQAMVDCVQPRPGEVVVDPACGTGGFLLATHEYLKSHADLDRDQKRHLRFEALRGVELVPNVARLCGMNLYLHGIGPDGGSRREPPISTDDALRDTPRVLADVVVTNPPFGKKSSITVVNAEGETGRQSLTYNRPDFWTTTSNKQLNFVQHVKSLLAIHGRAAVVVPDNVLFEGGAGETVRRNLLRECDVHTLTTSAPPSTRWKGYWPIWSSERGRVESVSGLAGRRRAIGRRRRRTRRRRWRRLRQKAVCACRASWCRSLPARTPRARRVHRRTSGRSTCRGHRGRLLETLEQELAARSGSARLAIDALGSLLQRAQALDGNVVRNGVGFHVVPQPPVVCVDSAPEHRELGEPGRALPEVQRCRRRRQHRCGHRQDGGTEREQAEHAGRRRSGSDEEQDVQRVVRDLRPRAQPVEVPVALVGSDHPLPDVAAQILGHAGTPTSCLPQSSVPTPWFVEQFRAALLHSIQAFAEIYRVRELHGRDTRNVERPASL